MKKQHQIVFSYCLWYRVSEKAFSREFVCREFDLDSPSRKPSHQTKINLIFFHQKVKWFFKMKSTRYRFYFNRSLWFLQRRAFRLSSSIMSVIFQKLSKDWINLLIASEISYDVFEILTQFYDTNWGFNFCF